jgi:uncharacterized protein YqhQ
LYVRFDLWTDMLFNNQITIIKQLQLIYKWKVYKRIRDTFYFCLLPSFHITYSKYMCNYLKKVWTAKHYSNQYGKVKKKMCKCMISTLLLYKVSDQWFVVRFTQLNIFIFWNFNDKIVYWCVTIIVKLLILLVYIWEARKDKWRRNTKKEILFFNF